MKSDLNIPQKTLEVSRARAQLTDLLRRLREGPRIFLITQSGKPAGALVNLDWLAKLIGQARGERPFSLFDQARASNNWEATLRQLRQALATRNLQRYAGRSR